MKTIRLISTGLLAVLMCVNFTACNGDDEEDEVNNEPGTEKPETGTVKRLKQYSYKEIEEDNYEYSYTLDFEYDQLGRITKITDKTKEGSDYSTEVYEYVWDGNTIEEYCDGYLEHTFTISDKIVRNASYDYNSNNSFLYNSSGRLITWSQDNDYYGHKYYYKWNGDKVTEIIMDEYDNYDGDWKMTYKISYGNKKCSGYCPIVGEFVDISHLTKVHPELFGCITNTLPTKIIVEDDIYGERGSQEFTYELDKDGYIIKLTGKVKGTDFEDGNNEYIFISGYEYNFVWE